MKDDEAATFTLPPNKQRAEFVKKKLREAIKWVRDQNGGFDECPLVSYNIKNEFMIVFFAREHDVEAMRWEPLLPWASGLNKPWANIVNRPLALKKTS
ncbi:MAG: hypothetical protein RML32_02840 [Gammaproteobacteria bacterium]|nr:hypothetical protein [Gammaproteobacteria bacterium]